MDKNNYSFNGIINALEKETIEKIKIPKYDYIHIFYDYGNGFSEEESKRAYFDSVNNSLKLDLKNKKIKKIRLDLSIYRCSVEIKNLYFTKDNLKRKVINKQSNSSFTYNSIDFFDNEGPEIIIDIDDHYDSLIFNYNLHYLG